MNHIGDTNKMVGDTPISDSTPHNVADLGMLCRTLERLASVRLDYINQLEANNDAANAEIERLTAKVAQLYEGGEEQKQRIKRLEEAGDTLTCVIGLTPIKGNLAALQEAFDMARAVLKAKEAK
jgi:peptidoglycan hydrolase CwlO-like protein